jgi:hypothetical protein
MPCVFFIDIIVDSVLQNIRHKFEQIRTFTVTRSMRTYKAAFVCDQFFRQLVIIMMILQRTLHKETYMYDSSDPTDS